MHLPLKLETATPPKADLFLQQKAFDLYRREYNEERPHEALALKPPVSRYTPSSRTYPRQAPQAREPRRGMQGGEGRLRARRRERIFISHALHGEYLRIFPCDDGSYEVSFGAILLGSFTADRPELRLAKRQRVLSLEDEEWMSPATAAA